MDTTYWAINFFCFYEDKTQGGMPLTHFACRILTHSIIKGIGLNLFCFRRSLRRYNTI